MTDPVNGVDYLVDYYSVLGVEKDASQDEITAAWREKVKQWHPDRLHGLAPELLGRAKLMTERFNEANSVLSDPEKRKAFDDTLEGWDKAISKDGTPIVDLGASGFSFGRLVSGINADPEAVEAEAEKLALQFSNYSPATYEMFQKMAESEAGIPEEMQQAYLEQLEVRELYLTLKEGFVWDSMGNQNHATTPKLTYMDEATADLDSVRAKAFSGISDQVLRLAAGETALLAPPENHEGELDTGALITAYEGKIGDYLDAQANKLRALAEEKETILNKRFDLASRITYHPDCTTMTSLLVVEINSNGKSGYICFELEGNSAKGIEVEGLDQLHAPEVVKEWIRRGYTFVSFNSVADVDFHDQLIEVITRHGEKLKA